MIANANRMFPGRLKTINPQVIIKSHNAIHGSAYRPRELKGTHYHVSPQCGREVMALQMLETGIEKFAPVEGGGVILTIEAMAKMDA